MRFDDSLNTILSAEMTSGVGARSAWRQLVDLLGRGRIDEEAAVIARLRMLRGEIPLEVRAASARALAFASPGAELVGFFAEDELAVAAPVLRTALLAPREWIGLLPRLSPTGRAVLRHRRDLSDEVVRALASFGSTDFVLGADADSNASVANDRDLATTADTGDFRPVGDVVQDIPVVAEALSQAAEPAPSAKSDIAELVERIDAFRRSRDEAREPAAPPSIAAASFRYETDAAGTIRWIEGVERGALLGAALAAPGPHAPARVDATISGALRRRARFADARLEIDGASDAAGSWRISGTPFFDEATGRFLGYHGRARRPRRDETAEGRATDTGAANALRQLVHELRTPASAIVGFAELIETELFGAVPDAHRSRAQSIRRQALNLVAAIEDLDMAARLESGALELRPRIIDVAPVLRHVLDGLTPLAQLRGAALMLHADVGEAPVEADERALDRLLGRLLSALLGSAAEGETLNVTMGRSGHEVIVAVDRPGHLADTGDEALLRIEASEEDGATSPLLGIGFAVRLAGKLARELGGTLVIAADALTLRLPRAVDRETGQASTR